MKPAEIQRALDEARPGTLERELTRLALERTGATLGALFLWDRKAKGLVLAHHVVEAQGPESVSQRPACRQALGSRGGEQVVHGEMPQVPWGSNLRPSSSRWARSIGPGAEVSGSPPDWVLG